MQSCACGVDLPVGEIRQVVETVDSIEGAFVIGEVGDLIPPVVHAGLEGVLAPHIGEIVHQLHLAHVAALGKTAGDAEFREAAVTHIHGFRHEREGF